MLNNVKPVLPIMFVWEFMPKPQLQVDIQERDWKEEWKSLKAFSKNNKWKIDIEFLKKVCKDDTHAIVVTDLDQQIGYINSHFEKMTGYNATEVLGKSPEFLQGPDTETKTRGKISHALRSNQNVQAELTNYRKNGEAYICSLDITPIFNRQNELVNFLALEKEVEQVAVL